MLKFQTININNFLYYGLSRNKHNVLMNDTGIVTPMKPRIEALNVDQPFVGEKFRRHRIGFL